MDLLRRRLSPLIDPAWEMIDQEARRILSTNLSGRRVVDLRGPEGWEFSAIDLGRVEPGGETGGALSWGIRRVLPLIELRVPFVVSLTELDNLARGALDVDLDPVAAAAHEAARFEERAIYHGFSAAGITGLREASEHPVIELGHTPADILDAVSKALVVFHDAGVAGPHELVLGPGIYQMVLSDNSTYPLRQQLAMLVGRPPVYSPVLAAAGLLISTRGGDFELTHGQDMSIGYDHHAGDRVHLFVLESFTFRVIGPEAVVRLA